MNAVQISYDLRTEEHIRKVNSLYKQLESHISRSKETANRAYMQVQDRKKMLHQNMDERVFNYNMYRYAFLVLIIIGMLFLLRQMIKQIFQLVDKHEKSKRDLEENNLTIQKILDSLPVGIALANRKQEIKQINKTALKWMSNAHEADYIDKHCGNVFCLEDEEKCPITSSNLAIHDIELGLRHQNGQTSAVLKSAIPIRLHNEDMILEAFMDISRQKRAEQELMDQKQFNHAVLNSALVGIVVIDAKSHEILSINEKAREMIGAEDVDIIGNICNNFICPADKGSCPISDLDESVHNQQKTLITASKELKYILKSVKKAEINGREVYVESFIDISERKRAEQELRKLSMVVQETQNSVLITNANAEIEYVNPAFEKITGYSFDEVKGKNPRLLNAKVSENTVDYKKMWETINGGHVWRGEFCNKKKDGSIFWELSSISPVRNIKGDITHFIAIKDDITDRKKFESELTQAKEHADKANKAKSFFLAKMSHEIRTPMNGIIGMTDILMQGAQEVDLKDKLKVISISAENLLTIINEILDFSKIEAGQVELEYIPYSLKRLLDEVEELLIIKAKEKSLYLKTRISDQLPKYIYGDPTRTKQIIINLVNNAIKFTEEGGITIFLENKRQHLQSNKFILGINVIDTGIGISEEGKKKLFKAFSQTDSSTTRTHGGTGLGLLISKDLSILLGGNIGVDSQLGEGSTFWVEIPTEEASQQVKEKLKPQKEETFEKKNLNILLAEDNKINQKIAIINLEKLGHRVDVASNGKEAFEMFMECNYDLILMDIQMPQLSGLEATGLIREYEIKSKRIKKTPIIALTANALTTDKDKYIAAGMNDYLSKPFKQQDLVRILTELY
jgi:PAS domain S-box-containing protein